MDTRTSEDDRPGRSYDGHLGKKISRLDAGKSTGMRSGISSLEGVDCLDLIFLAGHSANYYSPHYYYLNAWPTARTRHFKDPLFSAKCKSKCGGLTHLLSGGKKKEEKKKRKIRHSGTGMT
ncbi:uncharacterized protein L3040_006669 [Drepanopeziza brunnea f. sp. 'multigermtubi']|uniref:uncharacterized protein n=1 Tax=Drepanopeziza brunnea f. sp. 'multigermtubi' TaxID=698441 RepID=UPI0023A13C0D|nr:hypothetical protein L3040_006669 [Drepanopeziza brunnea f. sp. 'multigermtubi']